MSQRNDGDFKLAERLALRPAEVAEVLGVSERHIRQLLPQLPHVRLGGCVVVPVEGLREWLREQARSGDNTEASERVGTSVQRAVNALGIE